MVVGIKQNTAELQPEILIDRHKKCKFTI